MSQFPHSYDPAIAPNSTTNRSATPLDLNIQQRLIAFVPTDCIITVASTAVTIQFYDALGRPFRGNVAFKLRQTVSGLGSAQETGNGRIPATATTGSVLLVVTSTYNVEFITNSSGAFACTLSGALTAPDKLIVENATKAFCHT